MSQAPQTVRANIEAIAALERKARAERRLPERLADVIAGAVGTVWFVLAHLAIFAIWALWNTGLLGGLRPFDPYPFVFLCMLVSLEAVLLSAFVLIKQNRMSARGDERTQLDLQVSLLIERELTEGLRLMSAMASRMGLAADDPALAEARDATAIGAIAEEVRRLSQDE